MSRKVLCLILATLPACFSGGCIIVFGGVTPVGCTSGQKHVVEIDDELYVVDLNTKTVRPLEEGEREMSTTTTTTTETRTDQP